MSDTKFASCKRKRTRRILDAKIPTVFNVLVILNEHKEGSILSIFVSSLKGFLGNWMPETCHCDGRYQKSNKTGFYLTFARRQFEGTLTLYTYHFPFCTSFSDNIAQSPIFTSKTYILLLLS